MDIYRSVPDCKDDYSIVMSSSSLRSIPRLGSSGGVDDSVAMDADRSSQVPQSMRANKTEEAQRLGFRVDAKKLR